MGSNSASASPLFSLPISTSPASANKPSDSGSVTVTTPASNVYLVSFSSPPDNRLAPALTLTLRTALLIIRHKHPKGVVIITSAIPKFFSNGLNYEAAMADPEFFPTIMFPLWHTILTYPMPVIALINGHAFAAGFMLAMFCDYRIMNPSKGYLCLNELDFGAELKPAMASIYRQKMPSLQVFREVVLESKRFSSKAALEAGIVDGLGGLDETLEYIKAKNLTEKAKSTTFGKTKEAALYRETVLHLENFKTDMVYEENRVQIMKKRYEAEKEEVEAWEKSQKAKL